MADPCEKLPCAAERCYERRASALPGHPKPPRMRTTKPLIWLLMSATVSSQLALTIFLPALPTIARSFDVAYPTNS